MGFSFDRLTIEVEGKKYSTRYNEDLKNRMINYGNKLQDYRNMDVNTQESIDAACDLVEEALDSMFGEGTSQEIFQGNRYVFDHIDLMQYLLEEANKKKNEKADRYKTLIDNHNSNVKLNRQQRRKQNKGKR